MKRKRRKKRKKLIFIIIFIIFAILGSFMFIISKPQKSELTIIIDPGHGGNEVGAAYIYDNIEIYEKNLNFKISQYIKDELKNYKTISGKEINVYLTHDDNKLNPSIKQRVQLGKNKNADLILSIHNNADDTKTKNGAMVLVTNSHYKPENSKSQNIFNEENDIANYILSELQNIGLDFSKSGILRRLSVDGSTYPNGEITDWYGIVRYGVEQGIPSIIVEHAYLDNYKDYSNFLNTDEKLKKLAIADVNGLAKYYKLIKK